MGVPAGFRFVQSQNNGSLGHEPGLPADCECGQHQTIKFWAKPTSTAVVVGGFTSLVLKYKPV